MNQSTQIGSEVYYWVLSNYKDLEEVYKNLPQTQKSDIPFALFCIAMYVKHQSLS